MPCSAVQSNPGKETKVSKVQHDETDVVKPQDAKAGELAREPASERPPEEPGILDEICVEELAIDGICGVY